MRLEDAIQEYLTAMTGEIAASTHRFYSRALAVALTHFGPDCDVTQLEPADVRGYRAWLTNRRPAGRGKGKTLAPITVCNYLKSFNRLMNWLVAESALNDNPAQRIRVRLPDERVRAISESDYQHLLAAATRDGLRSRLLILLLAATGCRVGALARIRREDITFDTDGKQGSIQLQEKGGKWHRVYFGEDAYIALCGWLPVIGESSPWLFPGIRGAGHIRPGTIRTKIAEIGAAAGIEGQYNPHSFRHRFARIFLQRGGNLAALSQLLGHSDVAITAKYYARWADSELAQWHRQTQPGRVGQQ